MTLTPEQEKEVMDAWKKLWAPRLTRPDKDGVWFGYFRLGFISARGWDKEPEWEEIDHETAADLLKQKKPLEWYWPEQKAWMPATGGIECPPSIKYRARRGWYKEGK